MGRASRFSCAGVFAEKDGGYGFELAAGVVDEGGVCRGGGDCTAVYKVGKKKGLILDFVIHYMIIRRLYVL